LIVEAGFPPGVVNILPGHGDTGEFLTLHPGVNKVVFTGSMQVGLHIISNAGVNGLKRTSLELGGKSPNIIMDDADMDLAIGQSQQGVFWMQGQVCMSGSRVFVHEKIYDEFVKRTVSCASKRKLGDPLDPSVDQGPQIDEKQFKRILHYIETGKQEGAKLLLGGKRWGNKGFYIEPTVFVDVEDHMTIAKEEIFGPVFCIFKFRDVDEVIRRANNTCYGLGAGVVTKNLETAIKVVNGVRAGNVFVNCYGMVNASTPFGGFKNSGLGREMGFDGIKAYTEQKTVVIKRNEDSLP
jgi:aldehyde dehydrogenase (NAD+)